MTEDEAFAKAVANGAFAGMHKPPYVRKEVIGDCTLILGDSRVCVRFALWSGLFCSRPALWRFGGAKHKDCCSSWCPQE